ncbi:MAG: phage Gp37/Gp68 family protein [Blastocatellia bacterium]
MASNSKIEWTTHTFNPWIGCTKVSDGCKNCYAENMASRFGYDVWGIGKQRRLLSDAHWQQPIKWDKKAKKEGLRYRVFCASMADVFEENAPDGQLERLWKVIKQTPNLDWQLLTKRPHRIAQNLPHDWKDGYDNVWLGTSLEDERVINRITSLTSVAAIVHFISIEPLLGPLPNLPLENIDWVIVGGESGHSARVMEVAWVLDIQQQCLASNTAFFFKQWGGTNKKATGRELNGRTYDEMPNMIFNPMPSKVERLKLGQSLSI